MPGDLDLYQFLAALGDDRLILGHRLSEWCGHAPVLEEDIALANIALDLIGQSVFFLEKAALSEDRGRDADALAFLRDPAEFRNLLLVEQPNGDFAHTIVRQFLFDAYSVSLLELLSSAANSDIAAISAKSLKEDRYHLRHSRDWVLRLGDGTEESAARMQTALQNLWEFHGELFEIPPYASALVSKRIIPDLGPLRSAWEKEVSSVIAMAKLAPPIESSQKSGGRSGRHSEHLSTLLHEMQQLQRTHPGAQW